jgi:hypothetical protein
MPVLIPYAVYTFAPFVVPRNLDAAIPFSAMVAAAALVSLASLLRPAGVRILAPVLLALLLSGLGAAMSWRLTGERSGFSQAAQYVARHGETHLLTTSEIMVFYLRGNGAHCNAPGLPRTVGALGAYLRAGYRYAVLDRHHTSPVSRYIKRHGRRVAQFLALGPVSLGESPISSENSSPPGTSARLETVDVFWLGGLRLQPDPHTRAAPCNRDSVA